MDAQKEKPRKKPSKIDQMTKEQIRQAIFKKCECNAKAQTIVVNLLEKFISEEYFIKCLSDINQSHFEDVFEERALVHLCGYPLCSKTLSKKDIPAQKYRISLKTNKVYDITARKNFCSNGCYKSAMHVKKQMLTSPLWFREYEDIPTISILPVDSVGSLGQEVDLKFGEKVNVNRERQIYTSINDFTKASLNEITETDLVKGSMAETNDNTNNNDGFAFKHPVTGNMQQLNENDQLQKNDVIGHPDSKKQNNKKAKKSISNPLNIVGDIKERPERKIDPLLVNKPNNELKEKAKEPTKTLPKSKRSLEILIKEVENCLAEWFTLDTLIFLFGHDKMKQIATDKGAYIKEYLNNHPSNTSNTYDQYQALCRKLNMLELTDRKYDSQTLQRDTKPLPDYSIIKEESKNIQLKVKAFYSGETELEEPEPQEADAIKEDIEIPTQLPLVDNKAQKVLRRQIVCKKLTKAVVDLLTSLNVDLFVIGDIHQLVNTFKLDAHNITFKPTQWTYIALLFIKLLSIRDRRLDYLLEQPLVYKNWQLLLLSYEQEEGYMDRLISWLIDIDRMLDVDDKQLTIE